MVEQNDALKFYYPKEGVNVFVDSMCIPANARQPELAKEYINFMLSEEPAVANALYIGYASPNVQVRENEEYTESMGEEAMEILYGSKETSYSYDQYYHSFTPEIQNYVNTLWENLKTENSTEIWVHVTTIVIVLGTVIPAVYSVYIKKKRSKDYRERDKQIRLQKKTKSN